MSNEAATKIVGSPLDPLVPLLLTHSTATLRPIMTIRKLQPLQVGTKNLPWKSEEYAQAWADSPTEYKTDHDTSLDFGNCGVAASTSIAVGDDDTSIDFGNCGVAASTSIAVGDVVKNPDALFDVVEQEFLCSVMRPSALVRKPKGSMSEAQQMTYWGYIFRRNGEVVNAPMRGKFLCGVTSCPWQVYFPFHKKCDSHNFTKFCLEHNHPTTETTIDDRVEITREKDLLEEEIKLIHHHALRKTSMPKL
jgi:hypothetical protein